MLYDAGQTKKKNIHIFSVRQNHRRQTLGQYQGKNQNDNDWAVSAVLSQSYCVIN